MPRPKRSKIATTNGKKASSGIAGKKVLDAAHTLRSNRAIAAKSTEALPERFSSPKMSGALQVATTSAPHLRGRSDNRKGSTARTSPQVLVEQVILRSVEDEERAQTPSHKGEDESLSDLYGLSPGGEASQANLATQLLARRQSMQGGVDASAMLLTGFKRRQRQPSILKMVARQSVAGSDRYHDIDDLELEPDDQSTPFQQKQQTRKQRLAGQDLTTEQSQILSSSGSRKRKRGNEVQVAGSPSPLSSPPPDLLGSNSPQSSQESDDLPEEVTASTEIIGDPEILSSTMADPMSSSSLPEDFDVLQDLVGLEAVSRGVGKASRARSRPKPISTVVLESLLPKSRRARRNPSKHQPDAYDLPSSEMTELSERASSPPYGLSTKHTMHGKNHIDQRAQGGRTTVATRKTTGERVSAAITSPVAGRKKATTLAVGSGNGRRQTYSRSAKATEKENRAASDDNQSESDASLSDGQSTRRRRAKSRPLEDVKASKELEQAREKFKEVDDWQMDYEIDDAAGITSSDWR